MGPNSDVQSGFLGLTLWSLQKLDESLQISVKLVSDRYELGVKIFGATFADGDDTARSQFDDVFLNLQLKVIVPLRLARVDNIEFDCLSLLKHLEDIRGDALSALDALARRTQYFTSAEGPASNAPASSSTSTITTTTIPATTITQRPLTSKSSFAITKEVPTKEPQTPVTPQWVTNKNGASTSASGVGSPMSSVPSSMASTPWSSTFGPIEPPQQPLPPTPVSPNNKKLTYPRHYQLTRTRASSKVSLSQQSQSHLSQVSNISDFQEEQRKQKKDGFSSIMETVTPPPLLSPILTSGTFMLDSDNSDSDHEEVKAVPRLPPIDTGDLSLPKHYMQPTSPTSTRPSSRDTDTEANGHGHGSARPRRRPRPVGYVSPGGSSKLDLSRFMSREDTQPREADEARDQEADNGSYMNQVPRYRRPSMASSTTGTSNQYRRHPAKASNENIVPARGHSRHPSQSRARVRDSQGQWPSSVYRGQSQSHSRHPSEDHYTETDAYAPSMESRSRRVSRGPAAGLTPQDPFQSSSHAHSRSASRYPNGHLGTTWDDYRLTLPEDRPHDGVSDKFARRISGSSRIAPHDTSASPALPQGVQQTALPTHVTEDQQHFKPRTSSDYLTPPAELSRHTSHTSDLNNHSTLSEDIRLHTYMGAENGRRQSEFSDGLSSCNGSINDKHRAKFWRRGRRNDLSKIEKAFNLTKNDNLTVTTFATQDTIDNAFRSTGGTTTTAFAIAAAAAAAPPNSKGLYLPDKSNDFAGFCKGAWKLQTNQRKAFRIETRPSGMYSQVEYWRCTKCDFEGSVNNPENITLLSRSGMFHQSQPSSQPNAEPFTRTVPNNGKLRHHFDQTIYSHPCGVRYRWAFLAKSHVCKKGDRWKGIHAKEAYACIFCCIANKAIPPVFEDLDMFIRHIRRHDGNLAEGHVEQPSHEALQYTKTIIGRAAGYDEEFDLNIPPRVKKRDSKNSTPSLESPSMRSWVAGSRSTRSQTSHS